MGNRARLAIVSCLVVGALVIACKKKDDEPTKDTETSDASAGVDGAGGGSSGTLPDGATSANHCSEVDAGTEDTSTVGAGGQGNPPCNGDWGSNATAPCPLRGNGFCSTTGTCQTCGNCNAAPGHAGTVCSAEGMCGTPCGDGGVCASGQYCTTDGACLPLNANGLHPFSGLSSPANCAALAKLECASGIGTVTDATIADGSNPTDGNCFCGKPNGAACASASECSSNICASNGKCGASLGDACTFVSFAATERKTCQNDNCDKATCTCLTTCTTDDKCGNSVSGKVCDPTLGLCVLGCRGGGGNGCNLGQTCSSTTDTIGTCSGS